MKTIKSVVPRAFGFFLVLTVICGVIYPLAVTGISKVFFQKQAEGSIIEIDGVKYGRAAGPGIYFRYISVGPANE